MINPWGNLPEVNFDAGRPATSYVPFLGKHTGVNVAHLPHFPDVENLINGNFIALKVMQYVFRAERHFAGAMQAHARSMKGEFAVEELIEQLELMIYCMRKFVDHYVQGTYVKLYTSEVLTNRRVPIDSLGKVLRARKRGDTEHKALVEIVLGAGHSLSHDFMAVLDLVSNAYKHNFFLPESTSYMARDFPSIVLFDYPRNDFNEPLLVHNHNAVHLMMGFQDEVNRLLVAAGSSPL